MSVIDYSLSSLVSTEFNFADNMQNKYCFNRIHYIDDSLSKGIERSLYILIGLYKQTNNANLIEEVERYCMSIKGCNYRNIEDQSEFVTKLKDIISRITE